MRLKNGILVEDLRHLGIGVSITNQPYKYVRLSYTEKEVLINTTGTWINAAEQQVFLQELQQAITNAKAINKHLFNA